MLRRVADKSEDAHARDDDGHGCEDDEHPLQPSIIPVVFGKHIVEKLSFRSGLQQETTLHAVDKRERLRLAFRINLEPEHEKTLRFFGHKHGTDGHAKIGEVEVLHNTDDRPGTQPRFKSVESLADRIRPSQESYSRLVQQVSLVIRSGSKVSPGDQVDVEYSQVA